MIIYKITNDINGKVYIGQTKQTLQQRKQQHFVNARRGSKTHLYSAIRKYGEEHFIFQEVEKCYSIEELDRREQYWIQYYNSVETGYNMIPGGKTNPMSIPEILEKHNKTMRTPEMRSRISNTMKNMYAEKGGQSKTTRNKQSKNKKELYNSPRGEITKQRFRQSFTMTQEHIDATNQGKYKPVCCVDEFGNVIKMFKCVLDGAVWWSQNGYSDVKNPKNLSNCIKRSYVNNEYIRGLKWIYLEKDKYEI